MICPTCRTANTADDVYCRECGGSLTPTAAGFGAEPWARNQTPRPSGEAPFISNPTIFMNTPQSGTRRATSGGFIPPAAPRASRGGNWLPILLSAVALGVLAALGYLLLRGKPAAEGPTPDHYGIFIQREGAMPELRRRDYRNGLDARAALLGEDGLPRAEAKPVLLLYAEPEDIPLADLKLVRVDSVEPNGSMRVWDYQISPVDGRPGMKRLRVADGLPEGKFAFAVFDGPLEEGQHRFWPFQVEKGAEQPGEPQVATVPTKPKAAPAQAPMARSVSPPPPVVTAPPPGGARAAFCTENNVVLRGAPGLNAPKIGRLSRGQRLWVIEYSPNYDTWRGFTANWAYVQPDNSPTRGWVFTKFVGY